MLQLRVRETWPPAIFWVPASLVGAAMALPLAYLLLRASESAATIGSLLLRARTLELLGNTIALVVAVALATVLIGVPMAWLTARTDLPGRRIWSLLAVLPLVIPTFVGGFAFLGAFGPRGMLQQLLSPLGVEGIPDVNGFVGAWLALTLYSYPYVYLPVRSTLLGMEPSLEEAARSLGKTRWETFRLVVTPLLRPAVAAGALLVGLYTLSDFGAVSLLRFDTLTQAIYLQYQGSFDRSLAAGFALVLVLLAGGVVIAEVWTRGRARYYRAGTGATRPLAPVPLGRWKPLAVGFVFLVVFVALATPTVVLVFWLARGVANGQVAELPWLHAWSSIQGSALAGITAIVAVLPVTILTVRYPGRLSRVVELLVAVSFALPGIVVALALVFFGANYAPFLYQTLGMLVFAYVIRFLPEALGVTRASLLQINPSIEEAARSLGRSPARVTLEVTAPLVAKGLAAAAALVFLTAMKELPVTLLLSPIGFRTLATAIWSGAVQASFSAAAVPALLLLAVSALSVIPLLRGEAVEIHD